MKNTKWTNLIRKRLIAYRKECLKCLYPKDGYGYEWGCPDPKNTGKTVDLVNKILKGIPTVAWPSKEDDGGERKIASNNWTIRLMYEDKCRHADLRYAKDDHTAWVKENRLKKGTFINFDIGGS